MEKCDVAIIGSGIGGLVCGCYLAKAGLKTLIVEKHYKPGGYCTSFERKGYTFNVAVHYLGGVGKGILGEILRDLGLNTRVEFKQLDPAEKIVLRGKEIQIRAKVNDTIREFKDAFPKQVREIDKFFSFITKKDFLHVYKKTRRISFKELLDEFFKDDTLKSVFGGIALGNAGLAPSRISALSAVVLFRQGILDPGYYPLGGIEEFPRGLADVFRMYGGEIFLSQEVTKIHTSGNAVTGIELKDGKRVSCKFVISNADAILTFRKLLDVKTKEYDVVNKLVPSSSMFVLYLGIKKKIENPVDTWYFFEDDLENYANIFHEIPWVCFCYTPFNGGKYDDRKTAMGIFASASYKSEKFWQENRENFKQKLFEKTRKIFPDLRDSDIEVTETATPVSYFKYTYNHAGAAYGWAPLKEQIKISSSPQKTSVKGLMLAGHWSSAGSAESGIPGVALLGKKAAQNIIEDTGGKWLYKKINP